MNNQFAYTLSIMDSINGILCKNDVKKDCLKSSACLNKPVRVSWVPIYLYLFILFSISLARAVKTTEIALQSTLLYIKCRNNAMFMLIKI